MKNNFKRLFAILMALALVIGLLPTFAAAAPLSEKEVKEEAHVYTEEENALIENDVFASIDAVKAEAAQKLGGVAKMTEQDYINIESEVIEKILASDTYVPGTLQQNGYFLVWMTTVGIPCCYDPRMEAELHNTADEPSAEEIARIEADAEALLETYATRGGSPTSTKIGLIQPYWESSSSYSDSSFTSYSPYYKTTWQNLYGATGGSGMRYSMTNATVDNIASTMSQCGLVIFDSHGTTDYSGSGQDYTSRANSSYLCLTTNSGVTSTDTQAKTGDYGTYYDCIKGSSYAYVNGQCISNHMSSNAPHSLLYMGICLGMATDKMEEPLRNRGVEVVYGYSQSVTFTGELKSIQSIMGYIQNGMEAGAAIEQSQIDLGCQWDPAYSDYSLSEAQSDRVAFPVVASSEDTYPGHGNVDRVLTAYSTWTLFGDTYTVTATSNNTSYGTVSVDGYIITASPKTGYYAQGYTVVSGTATVTQNGNVFHVNPSSDCTIRINFAAKTAATVTYLANGTSVGTVSGYMGDEITLRTSATDYDGWTFKGWVESTVAETTAKPNFYNPGATYTISSANTTLHALYTRFEEGTGGVVYELVDGLENGGNYILVDQAAISGTTGYAVGNTIVDSNHYLNAVSVTISDDTVTASNVNSILWQAASSGSGYTFYNAAVGKYIGLDSSEYVYPSSTPLAWAYTSDGYLDNQTDSEGYYYLSFDTTNTRYTTNMSGRVINLYKAVNDSTTYYWTDPIAGEHEHELVFHAVAAPTCTEVGNSAYYQCSICGKCFTDAAGENEITLASTVIAALGHNYVGVVTAPTETQQGYTTYTCSRCGDQYVDDYVPALGSDFTVHFSVPAGVTKPADMVSNTNTGITLPTVTGPEGYTFLGWVTEDYDNVETRPATILTGNYIAPQEITLKALFSYVGDGSGETVYQLVDALKDGGKYIIVDSNSISGTSGYAVGNTIVASNHYLNAVSVTINDNTATASNVANVLWQAAAASNGFTFYNAAVGKYMGLDSSEYLYPSDTAVAWAYTSDSYLDNQIDSEGYYYLSFDTTNTRYTTNKSGKVIYLYEETTLGTTLYTTIIGEEHVHTPGNPVVENNVEPTCTAAGSYDNVVYCTECGEELSRETVTVPALGHAPLAAVVENNVEPTCTVAGSYDNVVYCERCNAELSRETVTVAALNHLPGAAVQENYVEPTATEYGGYDMVVYCQRCNAELSREHTVLDPTGTPEPELDESLTFYTSVSIGAEIKTTFTIRQTVLTNAASWYLEVSKLDGSGNVLESKRFGEGQEGAVTNVSNVAWRAVYTDITAKEMGVTFAAVLHVFDADGNEFYGNAVENTVKDYIVGELVKTDNTAATRTLCADMLNYGAAAQLYFAYDTDNLVNENLSAAAAAALDQFETKTEAPATLVNGSNGPNLYGSVSVKNRVVLSITARNLGTGTTVQIQVKNHETGEVKEVLETTQVGSVYTAKFSNVEPNEMRTMFDFVALVDGVETGTPLTWSVEGYIRAARLSSDTSAEELALLNALLIYADSAAARQ